MKEIGKNVSVKRSSKQRLLVSKDQGKSWKNKWVVNSVDPNQTTLQPGDWFKKSEDGDINVISRKGNALYTYPLEHSDDTYIYTTTDGNKIRFQTKSRDEADIAFVTHLINIGHVSVERLVQDANLTEEERNNENR